MCRPVNCSSCNKVTWAGCGQHVDQVLGGVPHSQRCSCSPEASQSSGKSLWKSFTGR